MKIVFFLFVLTVPCLAQAPREDPSQQLDERVRRLEARVRELEGLLQTATERKLQETSPKEEENKKPLQKEKQDEWGEPDVEKDRQGRDAEARRRLMELETWRRKYEAEMKKREEEAEEKVKFEFSGKYKLRFTWRDNLNLDNPRQEWRFDDEAYFDQRFQLRIDAIYGQLSSVLLLDKGNFVFDWKEDSEGTLDRWGEFFTVNAALVRELYAQYTGDFVAKVGRQNWDVGHSLVLEGPMDSLRLTYPLGQTPLGRTSLTAGYMAVSGGWRSYTKFLQTGPPAGTREDVFAATNKLDGYYLGIDIRPSKGIRIEPYILKVADRAESGDADLNLDKDFDFSTTSRDGGFEPLWMGIGMSGNIGNLSIEAEAVSLTGSYTRDRDVRAHAFVLDGTYRIDKAGFFNNLSVGIEGGLGSGNDADDSETTGTVRDFSALFMCRDRHKFGNIFGEDLRAGYFLWDSNLANVTYLRTHAAVEPVETLKTTLSLTKIWTTEKVYEGRGPVGDWSRGASSTQSATRDVGWEADLNFEFPIMMRLDGFVNVGSFFPGDAYRRANGEDADPALEFVAGSEFKF